MTEYYTAMVFLSCLALCALSILVYEKITAWIRTRNIGSMKPMR